MRRLIACAAVATLTLAPALPLRAATSDLSIGAEAEAFALRVEYDLPVPAGPGTIPHVIGEIRSSNGENAKGLAGAPTAFDAVVAGAYYDPYKQANGTDGPLKVNGTDTGIKPPVSPFNMPPTTECFYPGQASTTAFRFPTDTRGETGAIPPTSYASAQCSAGPQAQLSAWAASASSPGAPTAVADAILHTGVLSADALMRPDHGRIVSTTRASANAVSILGGTIQIGSVEVSGASFSEGPGGTDGSESHVTLKNVNVGGQQFTVANDKLIAGGQTMTLDSTAAHSFVDTLNSSLKPQTGCTITLLGPASPYPQGFLLSRKPPDIRVAKDGTFAASMAGGMLLYCDVPDNALSTSSGFSPERLQMMIGFAYTMAKANTEAGGFGIGDIGTRPEPVHLTHVLNEVLRPARLPHAAAPVAIAAPAPLVAQPDVAAPQTHFEDRAVLVRVRPLGSGTRTLLLVFGFALLFATTHLAARRLRGVLE